MSEALDALYEQFMRTSGMAAERIEDAATRQIMAEQNPAPCELTEVQQTVMGAAFDHVLVPIHRDQRVVEGVLPSDHPVFPGGQLTVAPFYMNRRDPSSLGVWGVTVREKVDTPDGVELRDMLAARVHAIPVANQEHPHFTIHVRGENKQPAPVTAEQAGTVVDLLGLVAANTEVPAIPEQRKRGALLPHLAHLARSLFS